MILLLFAQKRYDGFEFMPLPGYVYFIEHQESGKWWSVNDDWTGDPHQALSFETNMQARTYGVEKDIAPFVITEHEFVDR